MLPSNNWTPEDTQQAEQIWADYRKTHNLSNSEGKVAGIDPKSGQIWIGDSGVDVAEQADGTPVFFVRIGDDYFLRKGRR